MKLVTSNSKKYDSIGYYVTLRKGTDNKYHARVKNIGPCRACVEITIPESDSITRLDGITKVINTIQRGYSWPVRFDWENVSQYLTITQFHCLERLLVDVPICVYNYTNARDVARQIEIDELMRRIKQHQVKQYRAKRRCQR